jgi:circadian clock protein KaiA
LSAQFLIGAFVPTEALAGSLHHLLAQKSFAVSWSQSAADFNDWVTSNRHRIDCLIVESSQEALSALEKLKQGDILLPALTVRSPESASSALSAAADEPSSVAASSASSPARPVSEQSEAAPSVVDYHEAVTCLDDIDNLAGLDEAIHQAVNRYLQLPSEAKVRPPEQHLEISADKRMFLLSLQQQRLSEKLRERLGYVGIYYKRNSQNFLINMSHSERQEFLDELRQDYRHIILNYFSNDSSINQKIDDFVNVAFFADMSVPKIVEIHMELIDDFSKQLQLEGRSDDILADYRLTLIDVIAHLCEMYRRSLPRDV